MAFVYREQVLDIQTNGRAICVTQEDTTEITKYTQKSLGDDDS